VLEFLADAKDRQQVTLEDALCLVKSMLLLKTQNLELQARIKNVEAQLHTQAPEKTPQPQQETIDLSTNNMLEQIEGIERKEHLNNLAESASQFFGKKGKNQLF